MMMQWGGDEYKTPDYKSYKADKFRKNRERATSILRSIKDSSLKGDDKQKLIIEIKEIVSKFNL